MIERDAADFLADLKANNARDWFNDNRARYVQALKTPGAAFAKALAGELAGLHGGPVKAKVFRINRDLRFSRDKTPYNAHLHISVADGEGGAAWMFGLDPEKLVIGYGCFAFAKQALDAWRTAVAGPDGAALADELAAAKLRLDPPALKRVPAPHGQDHPRAGLLRRKGLAVWIDDLPQDMCFGPQGPARIAKRLSATDPVRLWLRAHVLGG